MTNYICGCKNNFYNNENIMMLLPCEHFIHEKCVYKLILHNKKQCLICNTFISDIISEDIINRKLIYKQNKIDLLSIRIPNDCQINYMTLPMAIIKFNAIMNKLIITQTKEELNDLVEHIMHLCNIKINIIDNTKKNPIIYDNKTIKWINKKDINRKIVLTPTHSHYIDSFIMYYLFKCGFVASDFINTIDIGRIIAQKADLLIFRRNKDKNMVEKIKEYLKTHNRIVLYPEGALSNQNTIMEFRTGAFYTDASICPIVIKYDPFPYDDNMQKLIFKLITAPEIKVTVIINDLFHPPFNKDSINKVRDIMAKSGNLDKSRVSNKLITE